MRDFAETVGAIMIVIAMFIVPIWFLMSFKVALSEQNVSGVAYNVSNNSWLSGNTDFSIRASEDTYVSEENRSSYCLPPNSPYIKLVNEAAEDKTIKLQVETKKVFYLDLPWKCPDNVTVTKVGEK